MGDNNEILDIVSKAVQIQDEALFKIHIKMIAYELCIAFCIFGVAACAVTLH